MKKFDETKITPSIDVKENICSCIDNWLTKSNVSNAAFGRKLGISGQSVKRWRDRECIPDATLLPIICDIFNISLSQLFGVEEKTLFFDSQHCSDDTLKIIIDKYHNDPNFNSLLKSIVKLNK